jgi:hypothetical protein
MNSFGQLLALFTKGEEVANPAAWQKAQVAGNALGGLLLAGINVASAYGYHLPFAIDATQANEVGASLAVAFNFIVTTVSHAHIGVGKQPEVTKE